MLTLEERTLLQAAAGVKARVRKAAKKSRPERVQPTAAGQREPRQTDSGFLAYLRRQPCAALHMGGCSGPVEAAHVRYSDVAAGSVNPGMGRKNHDRHANPLCHFHHQHDQHRRNERAFWSSIGKDAYATAAGNYEAYQTRATSDGKADLG